MHGVTMNSRKLVASYSLQRQTFTPSAVHMGYVANDSLQRQTFTPSAVHMGYVADKGHSFFSH